MPTLKSKSPSKKKKNAFAVILQKPFRRRVWRFLRDLWKAIGKKDLKLYLHLGFDDPADTGQLWAFIGPIAGILATTRDVSVFLEPDFFEETLELDGSGEIRVVPLQLIYLTAGLLLSPSVRLALKQARKR